MAVIKHQFWLFPLSVVLLFLTMDRWVLPYDEGLVLTGAMRVAAGEVPHRDFYANYGPAQFYLLAGLFHAFGQSVFVERAFDILVRAAIVTTCYGLIAARCRPSIALSASAVCGVWLASVTSYGYPIFPVILLSLVAAALVLPLLDGPASVIRAAAAGAITGLMALFRYDVAFFVFVVFVLLTTIAAARRPGGFHDKKSALKTTALPYVAGTSIVFLLAAACYLAVAPLAPFVHDIFLFQAQYYRRMRELPFPALSQPFLSMDLLSVYLPPLICLVALGSLAFHRSRLDREAVRPPPAYLAGATDWFVVMFALLAAALYLKGLVRVSVLHTMASLIPSLLLLAALLERALRQRGALLLAVIIVCGLALVTTLSASFKVRYRIASESSVLAGISAFVASPAAAAGTTWCGTPKELKSVACFLIGSDRAQAAHFVATNTSASERILVGLAHSDKLVVNDNVTYFAACRLPATRWHHFDPGLQTSARVQTEMIAELETHKTRYVVLTSEWDKLTEPNDSAISSNVVLLDEYIRRHYEPVKTYGKVSVWLRNKSAENPQ